MTHGIKRAAGIYGGLQLEMNFDSRQNRLRNCLDNGVFVVLIERGTPGIDTEPDSVVERLAEFEHAVLSVNEFPAGLAITDNLSQRDAWSTDTYAACLSPHNRDRHLIYVSGADASLEKTAERLKLCMAEGFCNVAAVTGNAVPGEGARETRRRAFTDSVHTLRSAKDNFPVEAFAGCAVNPFKYTPAAIFAQYFKLIKKLGCGASFVVSQFGWDMMKLQELRWYLSTRGYHYPMLARLMLLTPEKVEKILRGDMPGVHISPDFEIILNSELKYSAKQFEAAQWRRLALQAAGCRFLGYSGVQISGLDTPGKVNTAASRIAAAFDEFGSFKDWEQEYREHMARTEMAPHPGCFYVFDKLFSQAYPEGKPAMSDAPPAVLTAGERLAYKWRRFLFPHADRQHPDTHLFLKKMFAGCRECSRCRLPQNFFICPEKCPKGLSNGPCGGSRLDGFCETGDMACAYDQILRLATWSKQINALEEQVIEPVERIRN